MKNLIRLFPLLIPIAIILIQISAKSDQLDDRQSQDCNLTRISDGDTIVCGQERIRFCGIDAPEISQPLGRESKQKLTDFCKVRR
ncbi:MAG: hypothetical protein HC916_14440 [Coleofasciculaceae cyanobacterium SM2_1_6]|nr:hypothetical protein [Coleofasciculaceae cyanobacterium SM2_1_6]